MMSSVPLIIVCMPLVAALLIVISGKRPNIREFWTFLAAGIIVVLLMGVSKTVLNGQTVSQTLVALIPGVGLAFNIDPFGLLFAFVASFLWIPTTIFSIGYMRPLKEHAQTRYFAYFALAIAATLGVAFSANLLTMYMFYELLSLSTYPLVTHHQDAEARTGGRKYLTYLLATSIGLVLPAMIITYNVAGTLTFAEMGVLGGAVSGTLMTCLLLMFLFGFAKAGMMPFHSWLPGAMVAPTPVSSLLHAVAVVKVGVFCILRIFTGIFGISLLSSTGLNTLICILASVTVVVASLIALSQDNLKRRLAFSTIGQLSYIILGAGIASKLAVSGSMLHIAMHAFGKITLFFCAGAIFVATGEKYISKMGGIGKKMPITMAAFFIGSLSVIGMPPAGGFISKWLMLNGAFDSGLTWVIGVYLVSSLLNAAYFFPIVYNAFFATGEQSLFKGGIKEAPIWAVVPPVITAVGTVILFLKPNLFLALAKLATGA